MSRSTEPNSSSPPEDADEAAHAAALAGLPGMGPAALAAILRDLTPAEAWREVRAGRIERPPRRRRGGPPAEVTPDQAPLFGPGGTAPPSAPAPSWRQVAKRLEPVEWWTPSAALGIGVTWIGRPDYPAALVGDPQPPAVLFWTGSLGCLDRLCVAIVGTRNATPDGRAVAFEMGRDLAAAGVCVVSGLALGIDVSAHAGALAGAAGGETEGTGATAGIAASGVDVPYPARHTRLWRQVAATGAILSENLPGRPAQAWRFPTRNRIIAGLVRMVVVVESHTSGGSLITAEAAIERGVEVRVVPGPVHSPASAGSNQLLYDGPGPVRHARDVLDALGMVRPDPPGAGRPAAATAGATSAGPPPDRTSGPILEAMGWRPVSIGQVMARTGLDAATVAGALDRLLVSGQVVADGGWWARKV